MRKATEIFAVVMMCCVLGGLAVGCAKSKAGKATLPAVQALLTPTAEEKTAAELAFEKKVKEIRAGFEASQAPYTGNLTPEKAAEITNAVAKVSLAEIPSKNLPKDPNVMVEINDRIRLKSDAVYAQFGTTMGEVMRYISGLSPQDRGKYNKRLTDLFLEDNKKKADTPTSAEPLAAPKADAKNPK